MTLPLPKHQTGVNVIGLPDACGGCAASVEGTGTVSMGGGVGRGGELSFIQNWRQILLRNFATLLYRLVPLFARNYPTLVKGVAYRTQVKPMPINGRRWP